MVAWIVNDLSLAGQFATAEDFLVHFEKLLAQGLNPAFREAGHSLRCARDLRYRPISANNDSMEAAIHAMSMRERQSIALRWLTKGPFWTAPPEGQGVVYHHVEDVTEQGLGEAARRRWVGEDARTFSFDGVPQFQQSPLDVTCLREGADHVEICLVPNDWNIRILENALLAAKTPQGWAGMLEEARTQFKGLYIATEQILEEMTQYPYGKGPRDRLFEVLRQLNNYAEARTQHGDGSIQTNQWMETYVFSKSAVFSSQHFANENMATFFDPLTGQRIYCPWHGKVHNPIQFRIHYEFPVPKGQDLLKVLYIGDHR